MFKVRDLSIPRKLTWMNMLVSGVALLLASASFITYDVITIRESMVRNLSTQSQIVGANTVSALLFNDTEAAAKTLSALKASPNVKFAGIYRPQEQLFTAYSRDGNSNVPELPALPTGQIQAAWFKNGELHLVRSIVFEGKPVMLVYIRSDLQEMSDYLRRYIIIVGAVLLTCLVTALLMSSTIRRVISEPILHLAETARVVSKEKNYSIRAQKTGNHDELAALVETFNEMLQQIEQGDANLRDAHANLERRVQERTLQLDVANKDLESFSYSVAHDLRAPIRRISGFSKIVLEDYGTQIPVEAQGYLDKINSGSQQMGQLVDGLLALARLGRQPLSCQTRDLDLLLQNTIQELAGEYSGRDIEWKIGELGSIACDPGLTKQVFVNLVSNALKYSRTRSKSIIEIGRMAVDGEQVMFIRDNGVGFDMKYADKLFGVFQRLHRADEFEGTGVGLSTVERIIRKHGGRIWVNAAMEQGATFFFTLIARDAWTSEANRQKQSN
jgi:signal transduction histidine kinase